MRSSNKGTCNKRLRAAVLIAAAVVLIISACNYIFGWDALGKSRAMFADGTLEVHMLDIGQGDCILIKTHEKTVLIDAGDRGTGLNIARYLRDHDVDRLDYVIVSHPHADHIGGMAYLLENIPVETLIMSAIPEKIMPTTSTFGEFLDAVETAGLEITIAAVSDVYDLGGGVRLTVLSAGYEFSELNNISVVCRLDYGATSFLFMGDAEDKLERLLVQDGAALRADVLKAGHHGSNTSSTQIFLDAVAPKITLISLGFNNSYNHPGDKALERLRTTGTEIYRTDIHGSIIVQSDGEELIVFTEK